MGIDTTSMQSLPAHTDTLIKNPIRMIVIDDDHGIRTLLEVTTKLDPRYELVATGASGADAQRILLERDNNVDLMLLDVTLPDVNGIELLATLHRTHSSMRIALFTGWSDDATIARAKEAGAAGVFAKDGDPHGLLNSLAQLFRSEQSS